MTRWEWGQGPKVIFLEDGEVGTCMAVEGNEMGGRNIHYYPSGSSKNPFTGKPTGKPKTVRNIPKDLIIHKIPTDYTNVPTNGLLMCSCSSCGRSFLRDDIFGEHQRTILSLKKESDMMSAMLIDLQNKLKTTANDDLFWKKVTKLTRNIQDAREKLLHYKTPEGMGGFGFGGGMGGGSPPM